ncbi:28S ribosomal protein S15, mitochondrial [Ornithorhynchus anatinus]|nr:28S ribosomal protein S15, mitochondrial [Ornithorhynchus anatinus]
MLRAARPVLAAVLGRGPPGGGGCLLSQPARAFAAKKQVLPSQVDDLPSSMLRQDFRNVPGIDKVDDLVKRVLSLEMAPMKEKLKIKKEQMVSKVSANPEDTSSLEARVAALTVKIRSYEEHMQKHRKDKAHKRYLLMSVDQRKKMLKNLRQTNYEVFEKACKELGIEYTFPPLYYRTATRRWVAKKALCLRVYQETQKLKKLKKREATLKAAKPEVSETPETPV